MGRKPLRPSGADRCSCCHDSFASTWPNYSSAAVITWDVADWHHLLTHSLTLVITAHWYEDGSPATDATVRYHTTTTESSWWEAARGGCEGGRVYIPKSSALPDPISQNMTPGQYYWIGAMEYSTWKWAGTKFVSQTFWHIYQNHVWTSYTYIWIWKVRVFPLTKFKIIATACLTPETASYVFKKTCI